MEKSRNDSRHTLGIYEEANHENHISIYRHFPSSIVESHARLMPLTYPYRAKALGS